MTGSATVAQKPRRIPQGHPARCPRRSRPSLARRQQPSRSRPIAPRAVIVGREPLAHSNAAGAACWSSPSREPHPHRVAVSCSACSPTPRRRSWLGRVSALRVKIVQKLLVLGAHRVVFRSGPRPAWGRGLRRALGLRGAAGAIFGPLSAGLGGSTASFASFASAFSLSTDSASRTSPSSAASVASPSVSCSTSSAPSSCSAAASSNATSGSSTGGGRCVGRRSRCDDLGRLAQAQHVFEQANHRIDRTRERQRQRKTRPPRRSTSTPRPKGDCAARRWAAAACGGMEGTETCSSGAAGRPENDPSWGDD